MDRILVYPASIPRSVDLLQTNRNVLIGIGMLAQELFGASTIASGFSCTPTSPTSLNVSLAGGRLYSLQEVDPLQYSTLPADTADLIVKQGIQLAASTLSCPAPATSGQSINYLIQASFAEVDTNPVVLPYYDADNPGLPFSGPNNSGSANFTTRSDVVQVTVKSGTPATSGSQTTPAPDTGFVGLWVVTVAFGQVAITAGNISKYPGAPLLGGSLLQALQGNAFTYAPDIGAANAYAANFAPAISTLIDGMTLEFQTGFANTAASTFSPNGIAAAPIVGGAHLALQGGEIAPGSKCVVMWKANIASWVLLESTGGALQVSPSTQSSHAVNQSQVLGVGQTKQVLTGSRALGTNFTNSTGKPILVRVSASGTAAGSAIGFFIDGVEGQVSVATTPSGAIGVAETVPAGSTYAVIASGGATLVSWVEYR
ncbi:hypothetical protein [Paraburkholderia xenovorans]|uniref:hypothetical protein n=1 Tax=Paraburkholderia xenovorans TaxID=36873 RepID=UPI0038B96589